MGQLRRIIVGYDLRVGGEVALASAVVLAKRCDAALRLVHVVEPLDSYQRISHPLTSPYPVEEIAQKIGAKLKALVAGAELAGLRAEYEVRTGKPLLGICLGMQWLYEGSEEEPELPGLGALAGRCRLLSGNQAERLKIPHVGWNALETPRSSRLLSGLHSGTYVYFTHSFAAPVTDDCVAATTHAQRFAAAVERDNVFGVQFHPEKSGDAGLQILRNFLEYCRTC